MYEQFLLFFTRLLLSGKRWPMVLDMLDMVLVMPTMARETRCPGTFFWIYRGISYPGHFQRFTANKQFRISALGSLLNNKHFQKSRHCQNRVNL